VLRILLVALTLGLIPALATAEAVPERQEYLIVLKLFAGDTLLQEVPLQFMAGMTTGRTGGTSQSPVPTSASAGLQQLSYVVYVDDDGEQSGLSDLRMNESSRAALDRAQHFLVDNFNLYIFMPTADRFEAVIQERPAPAGSFSPKQPHLPAKDYGENADLTGFDQTGWLSGSLRPISLVPKTDGGLQ
jgi:hypothetical protein